MAAFYRVHFYVLIYRPACINSCFIKLRDDTCGFFIEKEDFMISKLLTLVSKPEPDAPITQNAYRALWEDEHISKGMLASHLDPHNDGATNNHAFVFKSVQWIAETAPASEYPALLDLGCGAGIYAERFANVGYAVTGMDFSKRALDYAREQTKHIGSGIAYLYQNYLTINYTEQFDVVTLINKDYAVLSMADRRALLKKVYEALKPGGKFIFDVMTPIKRRLEKRTWQYFDNGGFFNEQAHLLMEAVYQYEDDDQTELYQYITVTENDVKCFICPNHYFTKDSLTLETQSIGFERIAFYGDVAGKAYDDTGETICAVLTK